MTTIRPNAQPQMAPQPQQTGADPAGLAAAKAFFALAAGRPAPAAEPTAAAAAPVPAQVNRVSDAEPPQKILRPGSILDIRV